LGKRRAALITEIVASIDSGACVISSLHGYVLGTLLRAFALIIITLTLLIWLVQVLRDFELVTSQAKTVIGFIGTTSLLMPSLMLVIAPIALVASTLFVLQRLQADSELVVMAAAGFSQWRIFKPFLSGAFIVSLFIAPVASYLAPKLLRELRVQIQEARSNLFVTVMQPGRFQTIGGVLTFHLRERRPDGALVHVLIDDRRNPEERVTITAETAQVAQTDNRTFLIFYDGSLQRLQSKQLDPSIVEFKQYAFDMTDFTAVRAPVFNVAERYLWDLARPDPNEPYYQQNVARFRIELNERIFATLYPFVFVMVVFAVLGFPKTSRQSRVGGVLAALAAVAFLRLSVHGLLIASVKTPSMVALAYTLLAFTFVVCSFSVWRGYSVAMPRGIHRMFRPISSLFMRKQLPALSRATS
jgi:lipopolysaccharide export system permease protein